MKRAAASERRSRLLNAIHLDLVVQVRYRFPHVYALLTAMYVALLLVTGLHRTYPLLLPVFLLSEPGMLGFFLAGAQVFFERGQRTTAALSVTPLRPAEYVLAKGIASAATGTVAGLLLFGVAAGLDLRMLWLAPPFALTGAFFAFLSIGLSVGYDDFARFLFGTLPVTMVLLQFLPLVPILGLAPAAPFAWIPGYQALRTFAAVAQGDANVTSYLLASGYLGVSAAVAWRWAARRVEALR